MALLFAGIVFIIGGITVIIKPVGYSHTYSMTFDFTNIKWPLSTIFIGIGIYCLFEFVRRQQPKFEINYWICPTCQESYKKLGSDEHICEKCNISLERLDGFFDRHPELKENN